MLNQRGISIIAVIATMLILAVMGVTLISLVTTGSDVSISQLQSEQAFNVATGGIEFEQRSLAQNLDWYRSATDPISTTNRNLGAGSFTVYSNLPATMLRARLLSTELAAIKVYSTDRFPNAGTLQIDDDAGLGNGEFVQYTGKTGSPNPTFTGLTRGVLFVGGTLGQGATAYARNTRVYPVATLLTPNPLPGNCNAVTITINANSKFLSAGTISVYDRTTLINEEITYTGSSTSGGVMTLTGVQRCRNGSPAATANAGDPVTPILADGVSPDYEAETVSTGTVSNAVRVVRKTVQR